MNELNNRLVVLMDKFGYKKSEWAELLNVSPAVISHIYNNRNKAGVEMVQMMLHKFPEVSERWLLLGEGEMLKVENTGSSQVVREKLLALNRKIQAQKGHLKDTAELLEEITALLFKES